jgi:membrane dipeptidase
MDYVLSDLEESSRISLVSTVEGIVKAKREGKTAMILCTQGCAAIEDDLSILRNFYRLGIRCVSLVVNQRNLLADSMWSPTNHGLSEFGEEVVKEANRLGIVIDVSHISKQGFMDTLSSSSDPLLASNVNVYSVCDNFKNLTDEMIKALAENGGVIGLHAKSDLVTNKKKSTVEDLVKHVDYITETVGVDHVGIGPDIVSTDMYPRELCDRIWGEGRPFLGHYPEGFEHISKMANITRGLVKGGYSDQEIQKVLGLNALRVFKTVWGN